MPTYPVKATLIDDDAFRLLAYPFDGPIPSPKSPRGVDLDGEWFSERTDIKPGWLTERAVDWHHGKDATLGREIIGKAIDPVMDEDGWWVTVWLNHGNRRLDLIRRLAEKGAQLFGSTESVLPLVRKDKATGHIDQWPYWRQTLSTSPQNTMSVLRPMKAVLEDATTIDFPSTTPAFWRELLGELETLRDLPTDLSREVAAKAGRELSGVNLSELDDWAELLENVSSRLEALRGRVRARYEKPAE